MRRERKYWIDWWIRDEIKERLKKHDDLIEKYRKEIEITKIDVISENYDVACNKRLISFKSSSFKSVANLFA
jgi:hypothetical protein